MTKKGPNQQDTTEKEHAKKPANGPNKEKQSPESGEDARGPSGVELSRAQLIFIEEYLASGNKKAAAEAAGVHRSTPFDWFRNNFEFLAEYNRRRREFKEEVRERLSALRPRAVQAIGVSIDNGDVKSAWKLLESAGDLSPQDNGCEDAYQLVREAIADEVFRTEGFNYKLVRALERLERGMTDDGWKTDLKRLPELLRKAGLFEEPEIGEEKPSQEHGED